MKRKDIPFTKKAIRETPPNGSELKRMLKWKQGQIRKLFNTSGLDYKKLNLKDKLTSMTEEDAIHHLSSNGNLVKRPFLIVENYGTVGFKESEWDDIFK